MPKAIEKDLEELGVDMFVNEYGVLRTVYNRLYAIIHVYYTSRRQLVLSEDTLSLEKLLQMRKDIAMRLERVNALTKDEQFPQENFEVFAKEKLEKMHLAIGLLETASFIGELSSYSKTIMDYMRSCCEFAAKFITVLSDPGNQNLKALKNNLATLLKQIDVVIEQSQSSDQGRATVPLSEPLPGRATVPLRAPLPGRATVPLRAPLPGPQMEGVSNSLAEADLSLKASSGYIYKGLSIASKEGDPIYSVNEALNILEKIDIFKCKSSHLDDKTNAFEAPDDRGATSSVSDEM